MVEWGSRGTLAGGFARFAKKEDDDQQEFVFSLNPQLRSEEAVTELLLQAWAGCGGEKTALKQRNWMPEKSYSVERLTQAFSLEIQEHAYQYSIAYPQIRKRLESKRGIWSKVKASDFKGALRPWDPQYRAEVRKIIVKEALLSPSQFDTLASGSGSSKIDPRASSLAFVGTRLVGFFLGVYRELKGEVVARWVAPDYRKSWVNAAMMAHALEASTQHPGGIEAVVFRGFDKTHKETALMARLFGAEMVAREVRLAKA